MIDIRALEASDAPAVFAAVDASRDAFRQWMVWFSDEYDLSSARTWIEHALASRESGTAFHFAICDADAANALVGVVSLEDVAKTTARAMLGYWVATPAAGRGVATRAVAQALDWARANSEIRIVWALVAEENLASRRVVERNGFRVAKTRQLPPHGVHLVYERALDTQPETADPSLRSG